MADEVVEETPVALVYNGISHVVMMMTPADLEDFALGFSLSEGIVERADEVRDIEVLPRESGLEIAIALAPAREAALRGMRRNLTGRSGCGLCGAESLAQAIRAVAHVPDGLRIDPAAVDAAVRALAAVQPLAQATGGAHGAAWCARDGEILLAREDVGRHNALDKLIGALARAGTPTATGFALVSSRASYEMVTKTARAGVQLLAAVSAPTTLAVRLAEEAGLTLVAFARPGRLTVYAGPARLNP
jgi:formate dehydrogenase accessory protein FdhD